VSDFYQELLELIDPTDGPTTVADVKASRAAAKLAFLLLSESQQAVLMQLCDSDKPISGLDSFEALQDLMQEGLATYCFVPSEPRTEHAMATPLGGYIESHSDRHTVPPAALPVQTAVAAFPIVTAHDAIKAQSVLSLIVAANKVTSTIKTLEGRTPTKVLEAAAELKVAVEKTII